MREKCSFEVKVELCFREFAEKEFDFGGRSHGDSLAGVAKEKVTPPGDPME
jgi:hypothetical protein